MPCAGLGGDRELLNGDRVSVLSDEERSGDGWWGRHHHYTHTFCPTGLHAAPVLVTNSMLYVFSHNIKKI